MTDDDRMAVRDACARSPEERIVITHGTDTMVETARAVAEAVAGKTVVLVGAMVPWSLTNTDSAFNVGSAIAAVQILSPGVYITMNGGVFNWQHVRKNRGVGVFELA